jgi:DnaJ-class molecular chaperone
MRLRSKGMPVLRSKELGDMFIELVVETPGEPVGPQKEILREFDKLSEAARPTPRARASFGCEGILGLHEGLRSYVRSALPEVTAAIPCTARS